MRCSHVTVDTLKHVFVTTGPLSSAETPAGMTDTRRAAVDAGVRRVRAYARRANSEDSIEVLSTTESIFPDDLTAITEEEAEHQPQRNGLENEEESLTECKSDHVRKEKTLNATISVNEDENERPVQEDGGGLDTDESPKQIPVNGKVLIKEEQVIECLKSNQVHEDKPAKMSKLLQGNTSARIFMTDATFKHDLRCPHYAQDHRPHLKIFVHIKNPTF